VTRTLTLLCLGDSLTRGLSAALHPANPSEGGYRLALPFLFTQLPDWRVKFVGSQSDPDPGPAAGLGGHEGYNGRTLPTAIARLPAQLAAHGTADVALVLYGTNDLFGGGSADGDLPASGASVAAAPGKLREYLDLFETLAPQMWRVVATIPVSYMPDPTWGPKLVREYNAALRKIVVEQREAGRRVVGAEVYGACCTPACVGDNLHLNEEGNLAAAGAFFAALSGVLPLLP
jgi:lysophospholipase L1-like esterase